MVDLVRVGADPELFVKHVELKKIVPVCGLIGGTKDAPLPFEKQVTRLNELGAYAYQEDGCAFEFNVPATTAGDRFAANMRSVWFQIRELLAAKGLEPQIKSEHVFHSNQLLVTQAQTIGCSPDSSAYAAEGDETRKALTIQQFGNRRFAGGHIHLGYDKKVPVPVMVRFMDLLIGLPSLRWDKQGMRRQYYGLPGLYRDKPYGLEYRSLSNYWVRSAATKDGLYAHLLSATVIDLGIIAQNHPEILAAAYKIIPWDDVKDAIIHENTELGREIFEYSQKVARVPCRYAADLWGYNPEGKVA